MTRQIMLTQQCDVFGPELPKGASFPVGSAINGTQLTEEMADDMIRSGYAEEVEIKEVD